MAPYPQCPLAQSCETSHGYGYGLYRLKDRDWLDYCNVAFVVALSVGLYLV